MSRNIANGFRLKHQDMPTCWVPTLLPRWAVVVFFYLFVLIAGIQIGIAMASVPLDRPAQVFESVATQDEVQLLFSKSSNNKVKVEKIWTHSSGLTGAVISINGKGQSIAWVTPDAKHFIIGGVMMNESAENESMKAYSQQIRKVSDVGAVDQLLKGNELIKAANALEYVKLSSGRNKLYIFADLNCHYCEDLLKALLTNPESLTGIEVRWVPVSVLGDDSMRRAASLIMAAPEKRIGMLMKNHPWRDTYPLAEVSDQLRQAERRVADASEVLLKASGGRAGTPTMIWKTGDDVHLSVGMLEMGVLKLLLDGIRPAK